MRMDGKRAGSTLRAVILIAAMGAFCPADGAAQEAAPPAAAAAPAATDSTTLSAKSALFRSLVLPGWGQAYVGAHGRGALYFALETASLWMLYKSNRALGDARELESYLRENGALGPNQRLSIAESRAQQVEDWITLSIFWALFAGADAYVSAQLSDFVGHVGARPGAAGSVQFQATLPLGARR